MKNKNPNIRKISSLVLQVVVVLIGIATLAFMLWEPHLEGVNANATTLSEIYFDDPFLAFAYIASLPFFVGLYHIFKVLGHVGNDDARSPAVVKSLGTIKYCAIAMIFFAAIAECIIFMMPSDDKAGGLFIGGLIVLGSVFVAATAAKLERSLVVT